MDIKDTTLALVHKDDKVLLGLKKRGFGQGLWNGFGGKIEPGETAVLAGKRELIEEADIEPLSIIRRGFLSFVFKNKPLKIDVNIFHVLDFKGTPKETEEMLPKWFNVDDIPYARMWPDDKYWLPVFLRKQSFRGHFLFENENRIIDYKLELIDKL